jgi:hypothetical protein
MYESIRLCTLVFVVTSAAYACTVASTAVRMAATAGPKVLAAPECNTVTETVPWLTAAINAGNVTITAQSNNAAGPRYGKIRINTTDVLITQYGTSAPTAVASVNGDPRKVPNVGNPAPFRIAHHLSPLLISISPLTIPANATADIIATSDGYFAHDVATVENYPALLTADGSAQSFTATLTDRDELRWFNVPIGTLAATATGTLRLRIAGLRATGTKVSLNLETAAPVVLSNADVFLTAAEQQANGIAFTVGSPFSGPGSGRFSIPVTVAEQFATAFAAAQGNVVGTRFIVAGDLFDALYTTFSQAVSAPGNAQLVDANERGAGGDYITGTTVFNDVNYEEINSLFPTYQIKTANDNAMENFTFHIVVEGSLANAEAVAESLEFRLAPRLLYGNNPCGFSEGKPITSRSANVCGSQPAEIDVKIEDVAIVGSNRRITYSVTNTEGLDGPSAPVVVRGNAGFGYEFMSCSKDGSACGFDGDVQETSISDLPPGTKATFVVEIAQTGTVPDGTLVENVFSAVSGIDQEVDRSNNQVADTFVKQACSPLTPLNPTYGAAGGTGTVNVPNCFIWTASSLANWITITSPASGVETYDPGTVSYTVAQNNTGSQRTGTLIIGGNTYSITQRLPCTFTVGPPSLREVPNTASATSFALTTNGTNCAWTATDNASWVTSITPSTGTNSQTVTVAFNANDTTLQRTATVTFRETGLTGGPTGVGTVRQAAGAAPPCVTVSSIASPVPMGGQTGTINVTASCAWTVAVSAPWLQVSPSSGTGAGTLSYRIYPNFGSQSRTGTISVGVRVINVTQSASPETAARRFVRLLYFSYFGRAASNAEVDAWVATGAARRVLAGSFLRSTEFNLGGRFAAGLYVGLLRRDPEFSGWLFQRDAIISGAGQQCAFATNFVNSQEFNLQNPGLSNEGFIRLLYRQVLGREPSPGEVAGQLPALVASGRGQLACNFLNTDEFRSGSDARLTAFLLYATLLLRDSTQEERTNVREILEANPNALDALLDLFANSPEINILLQ